jgi:hypothetical protein
MEKENTYTEIDRDYQFCILCVGNGKSSGAFGFALIFLLLFLSRKKVNGAFQYKESDNKDSGTTNNNYTEIDHNPPFFACATSHSIVGNPGECRD